MSELKKTKVTTGKVLFSYVHVFEPKAAEEGGTPKYSLSILIPKKDKKTIKEVEEAIKNAAENGKGKFGGKVPKNLKTPLRDGDLEREDDPAYEGCMFFNASSNRKPQIVDRDLNAILDREEFYSGCFGRASINFYAFNVSGNKGVAAGLNNLQKLEDGDRLSGGSTAEEDFADDFEDDLLG